MSRPGCAVSSGAAVSLWPAAGSTTETRSGEGVSRSLSVLASSHFTRIFNPPLQVVVGGPRRSVHSGETQSSVEISQAFAEDTGSYTVIARNRQGSAQHTVSLSVIGETNSEFQHLIHAGHGEDFAIWGPPVHHRRHFPLLWFHRSSRAAGLPACRFPAVLSVSGPVLDGSELRRGHSCVRLRRGGPTGGPGRVWELDGDNKPL